MNFGIKATMPDIGPGTAMPSRGAILDAGDRIASLEDRVKDVRFGLARLSESIRGPSPQSISEGSKAISIGMQGILPPPRPENLESRVAYLADAISDLEREFQALAA